MEKNRKKGRWEREYQNRERRWSTREKYVSLKELSKDINVPYLDEALGRRLFVKAYVPKNVNGRNDFKLRK